MTDHGVARDFTQGPMTQTRSPLDMAISGQGFFQVQTASGLRFTRDGRFATNAQSQLVTQSGDAVLDPSGSPITIRNRHVAAAIWAANAVASCSSTSVDVEERLSVITVITPF